MRRIIDPDAPSPRYAGLLGFGARLPRTGAPSTGGAMRLVSGKRAFFGYQVHDEGSGGWFANLPRKTPLSTTEARATSPSRRLVVLGEAFAADRTPAAGMIAATDPADLVVTGAVEDVPSVPRWSHGRLVLVGDAAHATSPSSGQGASPAFESAVQLARCPRDLPHDQALRTYEATRRGGVERIIAQAARTNRDKAAGPVGRLLRDTLMPLAFKFVDPAKFTWQFDHRIKSYDDEAPSVAEHYREVVRLGRQVYGRVEGTAFTTQLSLVGHLWRQMDRSGTADFSLEEEIVRLIAMIDKLDADESTRGELPLPADELRDRFTGMLESCTSWNARVSAAGAAAGIGSTDPGTPGYVPVVHHGEFRDSRLVEVYDAQCPWSVADDFFLAAVGETPVRVLDLGCGTGRLALGLARVGHAVTGVDPAPASVAAARAKPGADRVTWVEGTAESLPDAAFDVAVMTSHVAQFFVTDEEWARALADLRRALVPGGRLVFDTRDPRARRWERWNPVDSRDRVTLADGVEVVIESEVTAVEGSVITLVHHYAFSDGDRRRSKATVRFRDEAEVRSALADAGFDVEHVYGGWRREPVGAPDGELLVVARAR